MSEFVHHTYQPGETIAAIASPPGEGGVAVIRISGDQALDVAEKFFSGAVKKYKTHTVHYGKILNEKKEEVDNGLLLVMLGKRSYTGEDTVEIFCHGGSLITQRVLEVVLKAGARAAKPGEFTFKAFMNGKLDLAQAEAVQELICAKNEKALNAAENQLQGRLSKIVEEFQKKLTSIAAILEAWVDFPEEGLEFATMEELSADLEAIIRSMQQLVDTFHDGKILHDGLALCLVGSPNAGKSSLMNALLKKDRAIVSDIPGTTRDTLEDQMRLNGLNMRLTDTAGIREAEDWVEKEGIRRSKLAMSQADLILMVLDAGSGLNEEDRKILKELPPDKTIIVWNKIDLPDLKIEPLQFPHLISLSAKEGNGLDHLQREIDRVIWKKGPPSKEEVLITNIRHKEALILAIESCQKVIQGLQEGVSPEFLSMDMRQSLSELGKVIGTNVGEDILSSIFSTFCIGK